MPSKGARCRMEIKVTGLDKLQKKFRDLADKAKEVEGPNDVPVGELLTPQFMQENTRFENLATLLTAAGTTSEQFVALDASGRDAVIRSQTTFESWKSFLTAAGKVWMLRKMGLRDCCSTRTVAASKKAPRSEGLFYFASPRESWPAFDGGVRDLVGRQPFLAYFPVPNLIWAWHLEAPKGR